VFCWGRNDESQCGVGNLYDTFKREQLRLEQEKMQKEAEEAEAAA